MGVFFLEDRWLPKSVLCLRDYNRHKFLLDLIAGVTVGLVALPLAMAFAIASVCAITALSQPQPYGGAIVVRYTPFAYILLHPQ